jgi:hypothetical protein
MNNFFFSFSYSFFLIEIIEKKKNQKLTFELQAGVSVGSKQHVHYLASEEDKVKSMLNYIDVKNE